MVRNERIVHAGSRQVRGILSSRLLSSEAEVLFIQHTQITFMVGSLMEAQCS